MLLALRSHVIACILPCHLKSAPCDASRPCSYSTYHLYDRDRRHSLMATLLAKYTPDEALDLLGDEVLETLPEGPLPMPPARPPAAAGPSATDSASGNTPSAPAAMAADCDARALQARQADLAAEFSNLDGLPFTPDQLAAVR